jgi:hypothetical protein
MRSYPITDLQICSVRFCSGRTEVIIQKTIGNEKMMFGYCRFHGVVSDTLFPETAKRMIVGRMEVA